MFALRGNIWDTVRMADKTKSIRFRCSEDVKRLLEQAAERTDMSVSDFVRLAALREAREVVK